MPKPNPYDYNEDEPAYWLAQMPCADLYVVLAVTARERLRGLKRAQLLVGIHTQCYVQLFNGSTGKIQQQVRRCAGKRGLVVQFRHDESDWTRGEPEFVRPGADPLGYVNIAAFLVLTPRSEL